MSLRQQVFCFWYSCLLQYVSWRRLESHLYLYFQIVLLLMLPAGTLQMTDTSNNGRFNTHLTQEPLVSNADWDRLPCHGSATILTNHPISVAHLASEDANCHVYFLDEAAAKLYWCVFYSWSLLHIYRLCILYSLWDGLCGESHNSLLRFSILAHKPETNVVHIHPSLSWAC